MGFLGLKLADNCWQLLYFDVAVAAVVYPLAGHVAYVI